MILERSFIRKQKGKLSFPLLMMDKCFASGVFGIAIDTFQGLKRNRKFHKQQDKKNHEMQCHISPLI